ncbi:MAG: hypothetical protein AB2L14_25130 [Candidatus Xenobiia bacterium LiM19]
MSKKLTIYLPLPVTISVYDSARITAERRWSSVVPAVGGRVEESMELRTVCNPGRDGELE